MKPILTRKFFFHEPVNQQVNHLKDIYHLDKAHIWTLAGVKVSNLRKHPNLPNSYLFDLTRANKSYSLVLTSFGLQSSIQGQRFQLHFKIEPLSEGHFLHVTLWSIHPWLSWLTPAILLAFWATVTEDRWYFSKVNRRNQHPIHWNHDL